VRNETELLDIAAKLQMAGVRHKVIREVDAPYTNQCTAIGLVPLEDRTQAKKILSKLNLFGKGGRNDI
jgi:hypothetical protein